MNEASTISFVRASEDSTELMKKHGKTFYFASRLLGKETGQVVARLYALCRYIDDCADELASGDSVRELARLRQDLDGHTSHLSIEHEYLNELLNGAEFDARDGKIMNKMDLLVYCYRVAGAVGLMMSPLIGAKDSKARPFSIDLGIGMQLTNICRDVLEDAMNERYYLPESEIKAAGLKKDDLKKKGSTPIALKKLVKFYLDLADIYYESAKKGYAYIPFRARFTIHIAATLYREIGITIKKSNFDVLSGRAYVPTWKKVLIGISASKIVFMPSFWRKGVHKTELHQDLKGLPGVKVI